MAHLTIDAVVEDVLRHPFGIKVLVDPDDGLEDRTSRRFISFSTVPGKEALDVVGYEPQVPQTVDAVVEIVVLFFVFVATIALVQAVRKVPVQYAKRVVGGKMYGGVKNNIPLKVNAAGVMPIIFAQAMMLIPLLFTRFNVTKGLAAVLNNSVGFWYNFIFALMVIIFTYFYTAVTINPTNMAEDLKKNGGFIPGVKPGKKTADYLDTIMSRITLPGSIFLALVAILPAFAQLLGVNNQFAHFYGGTSLLILVGVILDTLQHIESHLLMRHYDGLMKTGRLQGRSGM